MSQQDASALLGWTGFPPLPESFVLPSLKKWIGPTFAVVLFGLSIRLLMREAAETSWEQFVSGLTGIRPVYLAFAAILIAMNYALLTSYDILALRYVARSLPLRRVMLVSFLGYSLGNNLGTFLAAAPLRFRFYSRWGLSHSQIATIIGMLGLTFWSGLWLLGGIVLTLVPIDLPPERQLPVSTRAFGVTLLALWTTYWIACSVWHRPWPIYGLRIQPPSSGLMMTQSSVAAVDLFISATALYLVLPGGATVPFSLVLAAYLCGIAIALVSQVPGGLGILEAIMLYLLKDAVGGEVTASLLIFRTLYYVVPLVFGMLTLVGHEIYSGAIERIRTDPNAAPPAAVRESHVS